MCVPVLGLALHATMWPYNFDFRPEFTDQRMRIVNLVPFAGAAALFRPITGRLPNQYPIPCRGFFGGSISARMT